MFRDLQAANGREEHIKAGSSAQLTVKDFEVLFLMSLESGGNTPRVPFGTVFTSFMCNGLRRSS